MRKRDAQSFQRRTLGPLQMALGARLHPSAPLTSGVGPRSEGARTVMLRDQREDSDERLAVLQRAQEAKASPSLEVRVW